MKCEALAIIFFSTQSKGNQGASSALADSLCGSVFAAAGMWLPPSARWVNTGFIYGGLAWKSIATIDFEVQRANSHKSGTEDSQLDRPFRDPLWNLPPLQPTAVQQLPRTHAGRGASPHGRPRSALEPPKDGQNHGKARKAARLRGGAHFPLGTPTKKSKEREKSLLKCSVKKNQKRCCLKPRVDP